MDQEEEEDETGRLADWVYNTPPVQDTEPDSDYYTWWISRAVLALHRSTVCTHPQLCRAKLEKHSDNSD